jgi:SAM-dependent methyltransferase
MDEISRFWDAQVASLNREAGDVFYRKKAHEHRSVLSDHDAEAGIIDLGCGAGEMLEHLAPLARISAALDYSESMLNAARDRLGDRFGIDLMVADIFTYLPTSPHAVWTTTGAINQYLDEPDLRRVLGLFRDNQRAEAFYLFDCIDPLRYVLLGSGISYRPEHMAAPSAAGAIKRLGRRVITAAKLALGGYERPVAYLGSPGMGYGQRPDFWLRACAEANLDVEIISSRYYEYRYHVIARKRR